MRHAVAIILLPPLSGEDGNDRPCHDVNATQVQAASTTTKFPHNVRRDKVHDHDSTTSNSTIRPGRLSIVIPLVAAISAGADDRPNFVFLYADDMTYAAVHALGNAEIQTPNLDRLARRGTTFTHAYNQGGFHGAICVASRAMLLTGRYLWHARDYDKQFQKQNKTVTLWPERLKAAGYDTYMTGKWHCPLPVKSIFDTVSHYRKGGCPGPSRSRTTDRATTSPTPGRPGTSRSAATGRGAATGARRGRRRLRFLKTAEARQPVLPLHRLQRAPRPQAVAQIVRRSISRREHQASRELPAGVPLEG